MKNLKETLNGLSQNHKQVHIPVHICNNFGDESSHEFIRIEYNNSENPLSDSFDTRQDEINRYQDEILDYDFSTFIDRPEQTQQRFLSKRWFNENKDFIYVHASDHGVNIILYFSGQY
jgi:hypothetical protein